VFLRNTLITNVETQIDALARTDVGAQVVDFEAPDGKLVATAAEDAPPTEFFVAIYGPGEGELLALTGGRGGEKPVVPATYPLELAQSNELQPESLTSADGSEDFRATVAVQEIANGGVFFTQLIAMPLSSVNRTIANYLAIYSVIAVVILVSGAFATRWLVTLTFRGLGQVETTADAIAGGDFSLRMTDIEPTKTEVGRLKTAINAMLDRVDAALSQRDATVRQMRRFIGDASHELRTPLVTVRGYAELYRMGAIRGDEDVAQSMERIEKEAIRMGVLVEDLLALARLDERRDVVIAPVDLRPIARDAALDVRAAAPMRPVTVIDTTAAPEAPPAGEAQPQGPTDASRPPTGLIRTRAGATLSLLRRRSKPVPAVNATGARELPPMAPSPEAASEVAGAQQPIVLGDENRIRQVVTNLLGNARRFTADDSPIELRVGVDAATNTGWIEVADHGEGVPDQIKDKIFQRFWRADTSRTRETGGSGLGLSIVASIVEALHGTVGVADTPGGGATFRVALPLAEAGRRAEHAELRTEPIAAPSREAD
jgi:two-component system OmpR family sensor kinase